MQIIEWEQFQKNGLPLEQKKAAVTIGIFDGVHRGHRILIQRIVSHNTDTRTASLVPVVVTFRETGQSKKSSPIFTFEKRLAVLERLGVKIVLVVDFTESFRRTRGLEFLEALHKHSSIGFLAVGSNFRCGYKLDTDAAAIRDFFAPHNIPVEIVPQVMEGSLPISSSRIRAALAAGDHALAEVMLGG
jgi:riboflavin kinase/FMN adenylyltransferase